VTFEQEAVRGFVLFEREGDRVCEGLHVLRVFDCVRACERLAALSASRIPEC
jgi:hypothetical protein